MSVKVQKPVPLSFAAFPRHAGFTGLRLGIHGYSERAQMRRCTCCMHSGQDDTAQNTTVHLTSSSRAGEAVYSEAGKAQIAEQIAYYHEECNIYHSTDLKKPAIPLRAV